MLVIDAILWSTITLVGLGLALWYGTSWRAVARALAPAGEPAAERVPAGASAATGTDAAREATLQRVP